VNVAHQWQRKSVWLMSLINSKGKSGWLTSLISSKGTRECRTSISEEKVGG
jgi:hypothetical protein